MHQRLRRSTVLLVALASLTGCAASQSGTGPAAAWLEPTAAPSVTPSTLATSTLATSPLAAATPAAAPTTPRTTPPASSAPPWCRQSDLRFEFRYGTGGSELGWVGSVLLINATGPRCALTGYLTVRFRDATGALVPVPEVRRPDPQTPHTVAIPAGRTGVAGLDWHRNRDAPTDPGPCPTPATLEVWLPPTVENPHPEQGAPARIPWVPGPDGGLCAGTIELLPVNYIP